MISIDDMPFNDIFWLKNAICLLDLLEIGIARPPAILEVHRAPFPRHRLRSRTIVVAMCFTRNWRGEFEFTSDISASIMG